GRWWWACRCGRDRQPPEEVVAELERTTEGVTSTAERLGETVRCTGKQRPDLERPGDGVPTRLEGGDGQGPHRRDARTGGRLDVEHLPGHDLDPKVREALPRPIEHGRSDPCRPEPIVGGDEREVADEDGDRTPVRVAVTDPATLGAVPSREGLVQRRFAAAQGRAVDDIVVQERCRVDELERDGGTEHVGRVTPTQERVSEQQEHRSQTLAAGREALERGTDGAELRVDLGQSRRERRELLIERSLHRVVEPGERRGDRRHAVSAPSMAPRGRGGHDGSLGDPLPDTWCRLSSSEPSAVGTTVVRPPGVPDEHPIPDVSLLRLLEDAARDLPDVEAVVVGRTRWTHAGLAEAVRAARASLGTAGVGAGSSVSLEVPDPGLRLVALWAVWSVGAAVVLDDAVAGRLGDAAAPGPTVRVRSVGRRAGRRGRRSVLARWVPRTARTGPVPPIALEVVGLAGGAVSAAPAATPDPSDAALVLRSVPGDAAGAHETVVLPHRALVAAAFQARLWVPDVRTGVERCLVDDPLGSATLLVLGVLATTLSAGTLVVAEGRGLARAAERERATLAVLGTEGLALLARARRSDLTALRAVLVDAGDGASGTGVPWEAAAALARASGGARVAGMTAAAGALPTHAHPVYGHVDPRAIGLPLTSTRSRVVDARGDEVPAGVVGTLVVDGPQLPGPRRSSWPAVADERGTVRRVDAGGAR
ncbi:MAG: hypothetical protein RLZZ272_1341, partial [Actinomycetota bacterium]